MLLKILLHVSGFILVYLLSFYVIRYFLYARNLKRAEEDFNRLRECISPTFDTRAEFDFWQNEVNDFCNRYRDQIPRIAFNNYDAILENLLSRALRNGFAK